MTFVVTTRKLEQLPQWVTVSEVLKTDEDAAKSPATWPAMSEAATMLGAMAKSAAHAMGTQLGRQLIRGVLGSLLGGSRRR